MEARDAVAFENIIVIRDLPPPVQVVAFLDQEVLLETQVKPLPDLRSALEQLHLRIGI